MKENIISWNDDYVAMVHLMVTNILSEETDNKSIIKGKYFAKYIRE